ncbi:MAG: cell division protein SepF [Chroococcidiopsidaceae cyanobacterium CP_BM_RX_35]|nr:cell division protein SepF [Chroococcidiopsidaceae cyanobacterium CP_BM_RX_35]
MGTGVQLPKASGKITELVLMELEEFEEVRKVASALHKRKSVLLDMKLKVTESAQGQQNLQDAKN